jgi:diguanylate cyclase (GGDEF)-like protein/PAS domain S-box-containing protein
VPPRAGSERLSMTDTSRRFEGIQVILDAIPNAIFVKDRDHRIVLLNTSACRFFGHAREEMLSQTADALFPSEQVKQFHEADDLVFETDIEHEYEEQITDAVGRTHSVVTRKRVTEFHGTKYIVASVTDITSSREAEAKSRYLALHDTLTGLPNRVLLKERIEEALRRRTHGCALLYIDLDRFKEVNDMHGHPAGDELIQEFARRLSGIVRAADTVARLGGDEFAILLSDTSQDPNADEVCRRVLISAGRPFEFADIQVRVGASIGIVITGKELIGEAEFQRRADVALYQAKSEGRGCFRVFTQALDERVTHRHAIQADLRDALATGDGLEIHYQPIVGIASGEVEGFEALVRWRHPIRGLIMPDEFIPVAEASGLIVELGEWVLTQACADALGWKPPLWLSVNVSPIQFASGDLASMIQRIVRQSGIDPKRLELEITEGVLIQDPKSTLMILNRIREIGVKIALDDFGVGYSSLSYFREFPFDKVKIDRTFIADMIENKQARAIVQAVISLGRGLNLQVVAEGVETHLQLSALTQSGCTHAQGYLFSGPMPISNFVGTALYGLQKMA